MEIHNNVALNTAVFFALLAVVLVASTFAFWPLVVAVKPLLLVLLSVWFFLGSRRFGNRFTILVQAGLFFSLLGDIAMLFSAKDHFNFLLGLGAFLIAFFAYALAFFQNIIELRSRRGILVSSAISFVILALTAWYYFALYPHLHDMLLPVSGLGGVVVLMTCVSAFRYKRTYQRSFWLVLLASFAFVGSFMVLGFDKYVADVAGASLTITLLYALGQYLLVRGALKHVQRKERGNVH